MIDYSTTYRIVRKFFSGEEREISTDLTLEEAQAWCRDPQSSSTTALNPEPGKWFDVYYEE